MYLICLIFCESFLGENLVSEPQSQGEETDQEEAGSVGRQRGIRAQ